MPLTGSCHLTRVHITKAGNTNIGVTAGSSGSIGGGGARTDSQTLNGEFRSYANGVTRLLTGTGKGHDHTLALRALSRADLDTLVSLIGVTCLFRDTYGRRFYGSFLATDMVTIPLSGTTANNVLTDVALTITEVTYEEGI
jgi:hypothetical protein